MRVTGSDPNTSSLGAWSSAAGREGAYLSSPAKSPTDEGRRSSLSRRRPGKKKKAHAVFTFTVFDGPAHVLGLRVLVGEENEIVAQRPRASTLDFLYIYFITILQNIHLPSWPTASRT
jgi:hypothetical protein